MVPALELELELEHELDPEQSELRPDQEREDETPA
eukprot:SAG31_NODE_303_length_18065_cov_5.733107_10_plen_35_part_00